MNETNAKKNAASEVKKSEAPLVANAHAEPNWETLSDELLLRAMAEGHSSAFDALFARHSGSVLSFLSRLTTSRGDSEDLLQETFLRILTHAKDFRPGAAFRPWLFTIARNVAYNSLQKRKLRSELEVQTDISESRGAIVLDDKAQDPSRRMQTQETQKKLMKALEDLPAPQREIIVLVIYNGFTYEEAAAITGDSEGTLRSRVFHALRRLRERLREPE
jgi:RNA polymerase sigma-70 factor (ECF subfamily)